jgi:hypothetical protein
MTGLVSGPDGPVKGATVRLERFVGDQGGFADVTTDDGGRYNADGVYGGKYRVRAWQRPDLATTEPQVAFVVDSPDATVNLDIGVEKHDTKRLQVALSVGDPRLGVPVTLLVLHDQEDVDENGIVRGKPIPNVPIDLSLTDGIDLDDSTPTPQTTGTDGFARFTITCTSTGAHDVTVSGDDTSATVTLPACLAPDADTTTTTAPTDPNAAAGVDPSSFPVNQSFTPPYQPAVPFGVYNSDAESNCNVDFEEFVDGNWTAQHVTGRTITLDSPGRNFTASAGSKPCTYRRTQ